MQRGAEFFLAGDFRQQRRPDAEVPGRLLVPVLLGLLIPAQAGIQ